LIGSASEIDDLNAEHSPLFGFSSGFLAVALARQRGFDPSFLARF